MNARPQPTANVGASPAPTGTVTFAFTDIEGSTVRWERDPGAMQAALRRHDALVRAAVTQHRGHVFKTMGDAFCTVFSRPEDAVAAMLAAQRSLANEDFSSVDGLRIRAAVHSGTSDERDDDYFGPAVNRVARLLAVGHGGQVLISGTTRELIDGSLPAQAALRDLGEHRLKDLARPEHVYQLVADGLDAQFPPLRSLTALANNLPLELTSFVGRETEVVQIAALLQSHRFVSIVGSGGVGKTRTSLRVAADLLDGSGDGVWFIELAPLSSGDYIPTTVAQAMELTLGGSGDSLESLVTALAPRRALLVFDNCEHLIEPAARAIAALLRGCPQIRVLASTRQSLGISGEATYRMPSLTVPEIGTALTAEVAARFAAIALFVERAAAADQRFTLTDDNATIIGDICRRLDGIPLAIELAAARIKILKPGPLRERLDQRFRVLTGGRRDVLPRQQTLRALIDWSYDLLDEPERALLRRLSVFVNGFSLEGAAAVGGGDESDVLDVLASLVDKSLVQAEPDGDAMRYRMLESTRAYAVEKLEAAGELRVSAERHVRFLRDEFVAVRARWERSGHSMEMDARFVGELDDVRAALSGAAEGGDLNAGAELLVALDTRWARIGLGGEGCARIERVLALLTPGDPRLASRLWDVVSGLEWLSYRSTPAREAAVRAVSLARGVNDREALAAALTTYAGSLTRDRAFDDAARVLAEAQTLVPPANVLGTLRILEAKALLAGFTGDLDGAAQAYAQLRDTQVRLGNVQISSILGMNLAEVEHRRGRTEQAAALVYDIVSPLREGRDESLLLNALTNLCAYLVALDRISEARDVVREALGKDAEYDRDGALMTCLIESGALTVALSGDVRRGARLAGYTGAAMTRLRLEREYTEQRTRTRLEALLRERFAADERESLLEQGASLSAEDAIALLILGC